MPNRLNFLSLFALLLGWTLAAATDGRAQDRLTGKALAQAYCAQCHQIDLSGNSPNTEAPPFWNLASRLPIETIDETLLLQLSPPHSAMPKFDLSPRQAKSIVQWIAWVQPAAHGKRLVTHYCLPCHAIGMDDESQHDQAPAFRDVPIFTSIATLREKFSDGIESNHPDMPVFGVDDVVLERILGHIETLQQVGQSQKP